MKFGTGPQGTPHITVTVPEDFPRQLFGQLVEAISGAALQFEDQHPGREWQLFCVDRTS